MVWDNLRSETERLGADAREAEAPFLRMADGSPIPPLPQRDMLPPWRLVRPADQIIADKCAIIAKQAAVIADLRAVLATVLDEPWEQDGYTVYDEYDSSADYVCRFCRADQETHADPTSRTWVNTANHAPGCPVLRADELLGR